MTMGEEKGMAYLRSLAKLGVAKTTASNRAVLDMVIAGEYAIAINIFNYHAVISQKAGAPVDWQALEPVPGQVKTLGLAKNAPHPAAGKLFIDFILSRGGQKAVQNVALRYPVRSDVELSGELLKLKGIRFWDANWDAVFRNIDSYQKSFRQTFGIS